MEERLDANKQKIFRYAKAFKNKDKQDLEKLSVKLEPYEGFPFREEPSPSVSRSTSQSSSHRGWHILRNSTFSHLRGEVNHALEEEVYHI